MKNWKVLTTAFLLSMGVGFGSVFAYTDGQQTKMPGDLEATDLKLNGNDVLDSGGTTRYTMSTSAPNGTFTGTVRMAIEVSTAPRTATAVGVPAIGQLIYNSTDQEVCFATAAAIASFVKISTPSAACGH